jgi:superfamily II DNA or RNA helicase
MKATVSNRIYLRVTPEIKADIQKKLTYKLEKDFTPGKFTSNIEIIKTYKNVSDVIMSIPQGRFDLLPEDYELVDNRVLVPCDFPAPTADLFPEQFEIYDQVDDSCMINALPGWGKTFTALHIAKKLGQKTLVITHTAALRDQWIEEVRELFGIEPGVIGGGKFSTDSCIVVGNVQTITKNTLELSKLFGTVILDEMHHVSATTFSTIVDNMHARYRIGLSGTLIRKDKKHVLFNDYFGFNIFKPAKNNTLDPTVHIYKTGIPLKLNVPWVQKVNALLYDPDYQLLIAGIAAQKIMAGYKVLIVADRTEFLENVNTLLREHSSLLVTGDSDKDDRDFAKSAINSGDANCICGSRQIFAEGISINALSCLILPTPMNNDSLLEQLCGRVMRIFEGKRDPIVIDMQFSGYADKKQNNSRLAFYLGKGWEVKYS